eukprot:6214366-Pleurochrysis_carterae.AAC.3
MDVCVYVQSCSTEPYPHSSTCPSTCAAASAMKLLVRQRAASGAAEADAGLLCDAATHRQAPAAAAAATMAVVASARANRGPPVTPVLIRQKQVLVALQEEDF